MQFSDVIRPGDTTEAWHQATCRDFSHTDWKPARYESFNASIRLRQTGELTCIEVGSQVSGNDLIEVSRTPNSIRMDPQDYAMIWLVESDGLLFSQAHDTLRLDRGDMFILDQSRPFQLAFPGKSKAKILSVPRALADPNLLSSANGFRRRIRHSEGHAPVIGSCLRSFIKTETNAGPVVAHAMLALISAGFSSEDAAAPADSRLRKARDYMMRRLDDETLSLEQICRDTGLSQRTLFRLFAKEGATPLGWLRNERLARAREQLLSRRARTVTEAAFASGFGDLSHFSRCFRARYGIAPGSILRDQHN